MPLRRLKLTDVVVDDVTPTTRHTALKKLVEKSNALEEYFKTDEGKRIKAKEFVRNLDDFGRWRLRRALRDRIEIANKK